MSFSNLMRSAAISALGLSLTMVAVPVAEAAGVVYVSNAAGCNDSGPGTQAQPYCTIQQGVDSVNTGGTVKVAAGTYTETVQVNKTVYLRGAQSGVPGSVTRENNPGSESIVNGTNGGFVVTADKVAVDGFTIRDTGGTFNSGIWLGSSHSGYRVENNVLTNNVMGVYLNSSGANLTRVNDNFFDSNNASGSASGNGIYGDSGIHKVRITDNKFNNNQNSAILLTATPPTTSVSDVRISDNQSTGDGSLVAMFYSSNVQVRDNQVTGNPSTGSEVYVGDGSSNINVADNTLNSAGTRGVKVEAVSGGPASQNVRIADNVITGAGDSGILLTSGGATNIQLRDNVSNNNAKDGIEIESGNSDVRVTDNSMSGNVVFDARDSSTGTGTAGTANRWRDNSCANDSPDGLCQ